VLPHTLALSGAELAAIRGFIAAGKTVFADIPPGGYDGHGRRRAAPPLDGVTLLPDFSRAVLGPALAKAGVAPAFTLAHPDGSPVEDVTVRVLRHGRTTILGVQRDFSDAAAAEAVVLALDRPRRVRDLLAGTTHTAARLTLSLDPVTPALLAIEEKK
jgi:hypothetical protein